MMPLRCSVFGVPPSTIQTSFLPSLVLLSMWIQACGLIHSTLVTGPRSVTGALASNSAEKAWCASSGTLAVKSAAAPAAINNFLSMHDLLVGVEHTLSQAPH